MSAKDLVKGLQVIDDDCVRKLVAKGTVAAAGELDLTEEEVVLLRGAAEDYPEVAGFAIDAFVFEKPDYIGGEGGGQGFEVSSWSWGATAPGLSYVQDYLKTKYDL